MRLKNNYNTILNIILVLSVILIQVENVFGAKSTLQEEKEASEENVVYMCTNCNNTSTDKTQIESTPTIELIKDITKTIEETNNWNIDEVKDISYRQKTRRDLFNRENPLLALRKQMNIRDRTPQSMTQSDARLEPNYTLPGGKMANYEFSGNYEQDYNKQNNKMRTLFHYHNSMKESGYVLLTKIECDFEKECSWKWNSNEKDGFQITSSQNYGKVDIGPMYDADNNTDGYFLLLRITEPTKKVYNVTSPLFRDTTVDSCMIEVSIYQAGMYTGAFKVVGEAHNHTWVIAEIPGDDSKRWIKYNFKIGRITQNFNIILEIVPGGSYPAYMALDNIRLLDCFPESRADACTPHQFRCTATNECINSTKICDIALDCELGDDETQNCDLMPPGARCNFEDDWCGWHNAENKVMQWVRHNGSTPTNKTGPTVDHTFGNSTGKYLFVNMSESKGFASSATINSIIFNPPPRVHGNSTSRFYNSCTIRFFFHQYGFHKSGISLMATEIMPKENKTYEVWWSHTDYGDKWIRMVVRLPNITHRYFLQFEARRGISYLSDVAIDDLSLSPECFGLNIPPEELNGYNYWHPTKFLDGATGKEPHKDLVNITYFEFSTCNMKGRYGPTQENCSSYYNNTAVKVQVLNKPGMVGVQRWISPKEGHYTMIVFGASGGKGSSGIGSSRGAMIRTVLELHKGQELLMLIGQEGTSACVKSLGQSGNSSCRSLKKDDLSGIRGVLKMKLEDGGGGGGGGTFVFVRNRTGHPIPLVVAAGGGGLGLGHFKDTGLQHGQAINMSRPPVTGNSYGEKSAGAGGGWSMFRGLVQPGHEKLMGASLLVGAAGGLACYESKDGQGNGGYGGGGGGCIAGGGGGGYAGGNAWGTNSTNGEGGYSFLDPSQTIPRFSVARSGQHAGPGMVILIPATPGCGCDFRCIALDMRRSQVTCICPKGWELDSNGKSCNLLPEPADYSSKMMICILLGIIIVLIIGFGTLCITLYNRYQQRSSGAFRRKILSGPDLQLNRIRVASDSMMTEYNPNYEFGGVVYTLKDLKDIPRDQLRLVKALGQGAFGEVYQGFYRQRSGDAVEMPVAVKTLPEMSTSQAEMDFLMEALIMSKFNHPNIVHFIGVCFDKHPRFIVLELLAGGDLKNFLRESRPKPERGSSLTMKDLVFIAIDVAKGCKYMEDNRFIHRDIAARNCLLTTKGPGRVVKIADFGMSRDIYRQDYYRKGGKAMLPIKWMPPEAFLDGIFTSKTDVWSFGVLLWEIMSMGYMPYTGCANREVMQLVTSGGRLEPPANCPGPIYAIMTQCWHPTPEMRPNFGLILERLGYCAQDPQVMNAPLPVFNRPPSNERDTTVMRPEHTDESYLKVPHNTDYLIPTTRQNELRNSQSTSSVDKLIGEDSDNWETSFVMPNSKSTQPLLQDGQHPTNDTTSNSTDKLIGVDSPPGTSHNTLSNNVANHNNNKTKDNLKNGLSLDACILAKQNMSNSAANQLLPKKPYVNINTKNENNMTGNGIGPYSLQNNQNSVYINNNSNTNTNESEINC